MHTQEKVPYYSHPHEYQDINNYDHLYQPVTTNHPYNQQYCQPIPPNQYQQQHIDYYQPVPGDQNVAAVQPVPAMITPVSKITTCYVYDL